MLPHLRTRGLVCVAVSCAALRLAHAQNSGEELPISVALEYTPTPGCPEVDEFRNIVVLRLGYDPFREEAAKHVLVRVDSSGATLEGRVEWRDQAGKWQGDQTFPSRDADCHGLVRTMGFALAVQIHLLATAGGSEPSSAESSAKSGDRASTPSAAHNAKAPSPSAVASKPSVDAGVVANRRSHGSRTAFSLGAGASLGFGLASSVAPLGRAFGRVEWPDTALELGAEVSTPSTTRRSDGAGFSQQAFLVSLAGCGERERWSACLLAKGGMVGVAGRDIDVPASPSGAVLLTGLRAAARQPLGEAAYLELRAEGLANWVRWTVTLDQVPVWKAPLFVETLGLDLGVRFQ